MRKVGTGLVCSRNKHKLESQRSSPEFGCVRTEAEVAGLWACHRIRLHWRPSRTHWTPATSAVCFGWSRLSPPEGRSGKVLACPAEYFRARLHEKPLQGGFGDASLWGFREEESCSSQKSRTGSSCVPGWGGEQSQLGALEHRQGGRGSRCWLKSGSRF